jgi:hypothetical protein
MFDEYHDEINNIVNVLLDSFIFVKEGRVLLGFWRGFVHGSVKKEEIVLRRKKKGLFVLYLKCKERKKESYDYCMSEGKVNGTRIQTGTYLHSTSLHFL